MKDLLVALLQNPVILLSLASFIVICGVLGVAWTSRYPKLFRLAEFASILFAMLCVTELNITPFLHWNPSFLVIGAKNQLLTSLQLIIYAYILVVLRLNVIRTIKTELKRFASIYVFKNPFFWLIPPLGIASCLWSETPGVTLGASILLVVMNIFALYLSTSFTWEQIFLFLRWDTSIVAILSVFIRTKTNAGTTTGGGLAGVLFSKNYLGALMAFSAALWLIESLRSRPRPWISITMLGISLLLLAQAKSGGGYFLFLALTVVALSGQVLKKVRYSLAVFCTSIYCLVSILFGVLVFANLEPILGAFGKDLSFTGRTYLWPEVWRAVSERFWLGYGVRGFWQYWRGADNPSIDWISGYWQPPSAHMGYLDAWVELGLVGVVVILAALTIAALQAIAYLIRTTGSPSLLPLMTVLYVVLANLSESRFLRPNFAWFVFSLVAIKLVVGDRQSSPEELSDSSPPLRDVSLNPLRLGPYSGWPYSERSNSTTPINPDQ